VNASIAVDGTALESELSRELDVANGIPLVVSRVVGTVMAEVVPTEAVAVQAGYGHQ
jgi:hypothetical protein